MERLCAFHGASFVYNSSNSLNIKPLAANAKIHNALVIYNVSDKFSEIVELILDILEYTIY